MGIYFLGLNHIQMNFQGMKNLGMNSLPTTMTRGELCQDEKVDLKFHLHKTGFQLKFFCDSITMLGVLYTWNLCIYIHWVLYFYHETQTFNPNSLQIKLCIAYQEC